MGVLDCDWSEYTNAFQSSDYTQPSLALVNPRLDFNVEWEISTRHQGVYITLSLYVFGNQSTDFLFSWRHHYHLRCKLSSLGNI